MEHGAWKADFEGAFGTQELRTSLDQQTPMLEQTPPRVAQDPPGEEWSDFTNAESS